MILGPGFLMSLGMELVDVEGLSLPIRHYCSLKIIKRDLNRYKSSHLRPSVKSIMMMKLEDSQKNLERKRILRSGR